MRYYAISPREGYFWGYWKKKNGGILEMATETVKTFELRGEHPNSGKTVTWCTGSLRVCAEYAALDIQRRQRNQGGEVPDAELDAFERALRKNRTATLAGRSFTIEAITEEYEVDEDAE